MAAETLVGLLPEWLDGLDACNESLRGQCAMRFVHRVLVSRNGKLVVEAYFPGEDSNGRQREFNSETLQEQHSVSKSVTGILVGIAHRSASHRGSWRAAGDVLS